MIIEDVRLARQPHYLIMLKLYVQPDGGLLVTMGNQRMSVSPDEVHALICGTLDYATVFRKLNDQLHATTLEIITASDELEKNSRVNGNQGIPVPAVD